MKTISAQFPVATPYGDFIAFYSDNGLAGLNFPKDGAAARRDKKSLDASGKIRSWHRTTETALKAYLAGEELPKIPPLDLQGTEFQKSVWREMQKIPRGRTKSYGEIAQAIDKPKAVRAVGGACGANPVPVFVPCHRVLAANNKIGGFSGGLGWKCKLLELEGIRIP